MMTPREFDAAYRRLQLPLGMYALRLLDDVDAAQDAVQTVFLRLWEQLSRPGPQPDDFARYAYRAVRNECLSRLRHNAALRQESLDETPVDTLPAVADSDIDTAERDAALWKAVGALPDRCREVFLLSKRDDLSHKEIAARMGISVKTVEAQITKALRTLRALLQTVAIALIAASL